MSTTKPTKINQLLSSQPPGTVMQSFWLAQQGYSFDLQKRYRENKWLQSIGSGAMIRFGEKVEFEGGIYALQQQTGLNIHPGGKTALALQGSVHYLQFSPKRAIVFG